MSPAGDSRDYTIVITDIAKVTRQKLNAHWKELRRRKADHEALAVDLKKMKERGAEVTERGEKAKERGEEHVRKKRKGESGLSLEDEFDAEEATDLVEGHLILEWLTQIIIGTGIDNLLADFCRIVAGNGQYLGSLGLGILSNHFAKLTI